MASEYHKRGSTLLDSFIWIDPDSAEVVTGLAQTDFTVLLSKNGTGGQSTTAGFTITEVANGEYSVDVSGSTGFVQDTGQYELGIYRTSDGEQFRVTKTYYVTSDGTGEGTYGDAQFTAVSGNGRVTDGSSALEGAIVRILNPDGTIYSKLTTDSDGLWGPVFFTEDGTYSINASKSGYSVGTGTITVSGSSATGPGADITITVATVSSLTASTYLAYALRQYGDRSGSKSDTEAYEILNEALQDLASHRRWPFYHHVGTIDLNPAYSTGTITLTNGSTTVTLADGTWPSWAGNATIYANGNYYDISSRDSDSEVTLTTAFAEDTVSGQSYTVAQTKYDMPARCTAILVANSGELWPDTPEFISYANYEALRSYDLYTDTKPRYMATKKDSVYFWPPTGDEQRVNLMFYRYPEEITSPTDTIDWMDEHTATLRRAIDVMVCTRNGGRSVAGDYGECMGRYMQALSKMGSDDGSANPRPRTRRGSRLSGRPWDFEGDIT